VYDRILVETPLDRITADIILHDLAEELFLQTEAEAPHQVVARVRVVRNLPLRVEIVLTHRTVVRVRVVQEALHLVEARVRVVRNLPLRVEIVLTHRTVVRVQVVQEARHLVAAHVQVDLNLLLQVETVLTHQADQEALRQVEAQDRVVQELFHHLEVADQADLILHLAEAADLRVDHFLRLAEAADDQWEVAVEEDAADNFKQKRHSIEKKDAFFIQHH